jgi:hypothetical protein
MKFSKAVIFISLCSLSFVACQDQVLNKEPQNSYTKQDIWSSISLAKAYLNKVYQGIGQWGITSNNSPREMASSATDEAMQRGDHGFWVLNKGNITPSNYGVYNKWSPDYEAIRRCNIFLKNIGRVPGLSEDQIKTMKAEARFIRAKNYEDLVDWYSWWQGKHNGVPIIKKPFDLNDNFKVPRASYSDVVNFIISDLDTAAMNLPKQWSANEWGRVTKGAALALKSEILLYAASKRHNPNMDQSKWQKAADAAKAVIDMKQYSLPPVNNWQNYADVFLNGGNHSGIILARPYDPQHVDNNWVDKYNSPNGYLGWGGNCPPQGFVDKFQMANGKNIDAPGSEYDPQHPYKNRELRFYADIVYNGRMYRGRKVQFFIPGGKDSKDGPQGWNTSPTAYTLYKFMDESVDFHTTNPPTPYIIFRLAEIYLNYAEAEYHLGNEGIARKYVNKIRTRVKLPPVHSSGKQLLKDIRHERTIELAFERDFRWNDVRRWGILDQTAGQDYIKMQITKDKSGNLSYKRVVAMPREFHSRMYSLPIPLDEIQKTDLKQNPGY